MKVMIDNARVLLAHFAQSDWRELHVRTPDGEIFIARPGGGPNRILQRAGTPAAGPVAAADARCVSVSAPHVGTVAWIEEPGTAVGAGAVVARLDLLGDCVEVACSVAGVVAARLAAEGDFVEFDAPLVTINPAS